MLRKAEPQVIQALASLDGDPRFETVKDWLRASLQDLYRTHAKDEVLTRWNQGAEQAVEELLDQAASAIDVIRKSRRP